MVIIGTLPAGGTSTGAVTAGEVITSVRDQIPDPVYDATDVALPDTDGSLFRSQTLYRWLDKAIKQVVMETGWFLEDWTAFAKQQYQPFYGLDRLFVQVTDAFANQWALDRLDEASTIYPNTPARSQPIWYGTRSRSDILSLFFWPNPSDSDPATILVADIGASGNDPISLVSTTGFLSFGYVKIGSELIQYQQLSTSPVGIKTITRGVGGTAPATHVAGDPVTHLSLWAKGKRTPIDITMSTSVIELPRAFIHPLELFVLARARRAEQEFQEAKSLIQEFHQEVGRLYANPSWRAQGVQVPAYGTSRIGPLAFGRVITR